MNSWGTLSTVTRQYYWRQTILKVVSGADSSFFLSVCLRACFLLKPLHFHHFKIYNQEWFSLHPSKITFHQRRLFAAVLNELHQFPYYCACSLTPEAAQITVWPQSKLPGVSIINFSSANVFSKSWRPWWQRLPMLSQNGHSDEQKVTSGAKGGGRHCRGECADYIAAVV